MRPAVVIDTRQVVAATSGFAHELRRVGEPAEIPQLLTSHLTDALGLAGAGVSTGSVGSLQFAAASSDAVAEIEQAQERYRQGPCLIAIGSDQAVVVDRIADTADYWPDFAAAAVAADLVTVAACPLGDGAGAIDLYDRRYRSWTADDLAVARMFAELATAVSVHATARAEHRDTVAQLQDALDSRVIIEQAKGIIAATYDVNMPKAFEIIRRHASNHHVKVRAIAHAIVELDLRPDRA